MDKKQFDLFQAAIQWVLDEKRITDRHGKHLGIWHRQAWWATGTLTSKIVKAVSSAVPFNTSRTFQVMCPSTACVAGNIVNIYGDKLVVPECSVVPDETVIADYCMDDKGRLYLIGERAQQITGMEPAEAAQLFLPDNSREHVIELATRIAKDHGYEMELV